MWLENKYIGLISSRLTNFKKRNTGYNFRCVYCGDSQKSKYKSRGWLYQNNNNSYVYHCYNCSHSVSFKNFLKDVDLALYDEYRMELLTENKSLKEIDDGEFFKKISNTNVISNSPLKGLKKISQLHHNDFFKKYISNREIPTPYHAKLFVCPNFMRWTNNLIKDKFKEESLKNDEARILIPFFDKNKKLHAYQGRSLSSKSKVKYITIVLDDSIPKVYGLDTVNFNKKTYVFEGPFDSMFIDNSISTAGGDMIPALKTFIKNNLVLVYDNEPRSKETKEKLDKAILNGYSVCIWPENLEHKDINDMILNGLSPEFIKHIIDTHTYKDLRAMLELKKWSKV